ncbi:EamA family transporter [Streptomyces microflavus]|uniref:EamA family transporter n=2 Tax=Streptomyces microflavus TaxID=1919 RepID=UPI0037D6ABD6
MPTTVAPRPQADPDLSRTRPARIALVGERSAGVPAHTRYAPTLKALWRRERLLTDAYGLSTAQLDGPRDLAGFDGIWLVPDSPYRGEAGAVSAVRTARERDIPLPATCGGFLHGLLGFALHVCALNGAAHTEPPGSPSAVTRPRGATRGLSTPSPAHRPRKRSARARPWSATRARPLSDPRYAGTLREHGLRFTDHDDGHPLASPNCRAPVLPVHPVPARTGRRHLPAPSPGARFRLGGGRAQHGDVIERHSSAPPRETHDRKRMTKSARQETHGKSKGLEVASSVNALSAVPAKSWVPQFVICSMIWGSGFALIKIGVEAGIEPGWVAFWRCFFGALVLWGLVLVRRLGMPRDLRVWGHALVVGTVLNAFPFTLFAWGEQYIDSVTAGVWNSTIPLFTLVWVLVMLPDEKPNLRRLLGIATGLCGALVVLGVWSGGQSSLMKGSVICLVATASYGLGYTYTRRYLSGGDIPVITLTAIQVSWAALELALVAPLLSGAPHWGGEGPMAAMVVLGAVGTGLAYMWNLSVIRAVGSTVASTVAYLTPLWAAIVGVFFLNESLGWNTVVGALLIVSGVLLTRTAPSRPVAGTKPGAGAGAGTEAGTGAEAVPSPAEEKKEGAVQQARP